MTTAATTQDETPTPKKPRKGSKAAKRIDELEEGYALAIANGETAKAARLRARIDRLEQGLPEEASEDGVEAGETAATTDEPAADPAAPTTTWNDVVAASSEAEANRVTREQVFDRILVDLTPEERAELGAEHVAADAELAELTDEKKEAMADFKARIAKVESKKREIAEAITKKKTWREPGAAGWICEEVFATNTRRYLDPKTNRVMCEEAIGANERQLALPVVSADAEAKAAQLSLGDVETTDATDTTDPEALLAAAQKGDADPADAPLDNEPSTSDLGDDEDDDLSDDSNEDDDS